MDLGFSAHDEAFRDEVRGWLTESLPGEYKRRSSWSPAHCDVATIRGWTGILGRKGWSAPHWRKEYGGPGWTPLHRHIFSEECCWRSPVRRRKMAFR